MTIMRVKKIKCPSCGEINKVKIWDTLNAQASPQAKDALLHSSIHVFICASCGETNRISSPLLYHDMQNRFFVYFFPFEYTKENNFYNQFLSDGRLDVTKSYEAPKALEKYQRNVHIVFSMDEMVRYIKFREILAKHKPNKSTDYTIVR
jgi:rRNA maturation protein Nop10